MSIDLVNEFHKRFGVHESHQETPSLIEDPEAQLFRQRFMREELREYALAHESGDLVTAFDSLLDLAYVVYGTALMMGITPEMWREGFSAVHDCNMKKVRAQHESESKRGSTLDVIKPEGWVGPENELQKILGINL